MADVHQFELNSHCTQYDVDCLSEFSSSLIETPSTN